MFIRLSGTGVHCDHTMQVSANLSSWLDSAKCLGTVTPKHVHLHPTVFFQFHLEERWGVDKCKLGMISQERVKIEFKLLLSANRNLYMPCRLAQQRMTLSDLEWPFHASRAISTVEAACSPAQQFLFYFSLRCHAAD